MADRGTYLWRSAPHVLLSDKPGVVRELLDVADGRVHLEITGDGDRLTGLLTALRDHGVGFEGLSVSEASLEDVFVRLTGEQLDVSTSSDAAVGVSAVRRLRSGAGGRQG